MKYKALKIIALLLAILTVVLCVYIGFSGSDNFVIALIPLALSLIIQTFLKKYERNGK